MIDYIHRWKGYSDFNDEVKTNTNVREPGILRLEGDVNSGNWVASLDSQISDPVWLGLWWNATTPAGSGFSFRVRVGASSDLTGQDWGQEMFEPDDFPSLGRWGRYIDIKATMRRPAGSCITPELQELAVRWRPQDHYFDEVVVSEEEVPEGTEEGIAVVISKVGV